MNSLLYLLAMIASAAGLIYLFGFGLRNAIWPEKMVAWKGRTERERWRGELKMSDVEMDRLVMVPWERALKGSRSRFVNLGAEHPELFPGLCLAVRVHGMLLVLLSGFGLTIMMIAGIASWLSG